MSIELNCPECGKEYRLQDAMAGKKVRCKACSAVMSVPAKPKGSDADMVPEEDDPFGGSFGGGGKSGSTPRKRPARASREDNYEDHDDEAEDEEESDDEPVVRRKGKGKGKVAKSSGQPLLKNPLVWVGGVGVVFLSCGVCCCGILPAWFNQQVQKAQEINMQRAGINPATQVPMGDPSTPFPVAQIPVPQFPVLGNAQVLQPSGVSVYFLTMPAAFPATPGHSMSLRIYMPAGEHAPQSIPCVLVAPAGTNLLVGSAMDNDDYHDETLPYAEAGMAVIFYSLDGPDLTEDGSGIGPAYLQFRAGMAGVVNGRNALEFALARLPQVNPQRIYSAGHSSAGTVSLLLAEHEPRLAGAIAFAPCADVETRLGSMNNAATRLLLPDLTNFLKQSSPKTHVARIHCPVFLFHAQDDSNVPVADSQTFATQLRAAGKTVELQIVPTGDHYSEMLEQGIPAAITWLKAQGGEAVAPPAP